MTATRLLTAAAFAALIAGPVAAQTTTPNQPVDAEAAMQVDAASPANPEMNTPPAVEGSVSTSTSVNTGVAAAPMPMPAMAMSGAVQMTAMAPIPDTAENRAKYGQPESNAGKRTLGEGPVSALARARGRTAQGE